MQQLEDTQKLEILLNSETRRPELSIINNAVENFKPFLINERNNGHTFDYISDNVDLPIGSLQRYLEDDVIWTT